MQETQYHFCPIAGILIWDSFCCFLMDFVFSRCCLAVFCHVSMVWLLLGLSGYFIRVYGLVMHNCYEGLKFDSLRFFPWMFVSVRCANVDFSTQHSGSSRHPHPVCSTPANLECSTSSVTTRWHGCCPSNKKEATAVIVDASAEQEPRSALSLCVLR